MSQEEIKQDVTIEDLPEKELTAEQIAAVKGGQKNWNSSKSNTSGVIESTGGGEETLTR